MNSDRPLAASGSADSRKAGDRIPLNSDPIDALFLRVSEGDRSAVEPAFEALCPIVRRYCRKFLENEADAEDAAQVSLIKMFEQAPDYDKTRSAVGFALSFAYWECRTFRKNAYRRAAREARGPSLTPLSAEGDPERELSEAELSRFAAELIETLSPEERALLGEEALLNLSPALSPVAQRKRKQRLLERLRSAFREILSPGGKP